ncbi:MAG: adenylosuccinate synthetase, partial [Actinomycetota bacterium]
AYTTRVGSGPFPSELLGDLGEKIVDIGHEFGTVTGRRRRPGWLDLVMLRHAVRLNSLTEIALTKLDVLDTFSTVRVCVGYEVDGTELHGYPDDAQVLAKVVPQYVDLEGWNCSIRKVRSFADLPPQAKTLIELVEQHVGVPVSIIGVGPERNECVVRR